jgi:hypothetical protein
MAGDSPDPVVALPHPFRLLVHAAALPASLLLASPAFAQPASSDGGPKEAAPGVVTAVFVDEAPELDGRLDDAAWAGIVPITEFTQIWPEDGAPATERTEAYVAYDRSFLYFGFRFHDREPHLIRAKNLERGGRNDKDDHAYIALDTYRDGRNAYLFEMNAAGTQDDATIQDESLSIDSFSWDAVFVSETVIDSTGWTMEVAIPFRQLRFPKGEELSFGLMLSRMINRRNERSMWPAIGLEYGSSFGALATVSRYGVLRGLRNVRRGHNIEIKPYVITGVQQVRPDLGTRQLEDSFTRDLGVDVKYGISSAMTLDLTVNTDFAQVEADNVQLNLDRFSLFFPEKREFFLERSGLFEHGNPRSTQTFFSRRIGLEEQILAGARLTGQAGLFSGGLLNIETGGGMGNLFGSGSSNSTVARVQAGLSKRATAGVILTNLERADRSNRAAGVDARMRFGSASAVSGWYTRVWDSNPLFDDAAGSVSGRLQNDLYGVSASFTSVGRRYDPALGFVRRRDMRQVTGGLQYTPLVSIAALPVIRQIHVRADGSSIVGQDGRKQSTDMAFETGASFMGRDGVEVGYRRQSERLTDPFLIRPDAEIAPGDYTLTTHRLSAQSDQSRSIFASAEYSFGSFFGGDRTDYGGSFGWRQSRYLELGGGFSHAVIDLPIDNGSFSATTLSLNVLGAVSRKLFAKALLQYDNFTRDLQANIRIDWIHTPGSDLFLVFNTSYHFTGEGDVLFDPRRDMILNDRVGVAKLTYLVLL